MNKYFDKLVSNITEVWLGLLLFVGLPLAVSFYLDWKAFVAVSFFMQTLVLILVIYKGRD